MTISSTCALRWKTAWSACCTPYLTARAWKSRQSLTWKVSSKVRVYLPATFTMLVELNENSEIFARSGWGFASTQALKEFYTEGDEEEIAYSAFLEASMASLRLLAIGDEQHFPKRSVVFSVDIVNSQLSLMTYIDVSVVQLDR